MTADEDVPVEERTIHELVAQQNAAARLGGPEPRRRKQRDAGKMLVRDRLAHLFDDGFEVEDGLLARMADGLPGDAVVTATGKVGGRPVRVIANDYTVKAGTWGRKTFEKITRMQDVALEIGAPVAYLVDSAGARIDEQFESYVGRRAWGNIFANQIRLSGKVPQVCAMFGPSPRAAPTSPPCATTSSWSRARPPPTSGPHGWRRWPPARR